MANDITYLTAKDAAALDASLMDPTGPYRFTLAQLMELAGYAVAFAVHDFAGGAVAAHHQQQQPLVVSVVCGPGNNGGDGIVAARHLKEFWGEAADVALFLPKPTSNTYFEALIAQALTSGVTVVASNDELATRHATQPGSRTSIIVDAVFGFSFSGAVRKPYDDVLSLVNQLQRRGDVLVCSVDVPSGWNVDVGYVEGALETPAMLISLTLPKEGVREYRGAHYVGGRFVPHALKAALRTPAYQGSSPVLRIS